jgi:polar amino acid transport system substrate-binding protein
MLSHDLVARQPALAERIWNTIAEVRGSAAYRKRERELSGVAQAAGGTSHAAAKR